MIKRADDVYQRRVQKKVVEGVQWGESQGQEGVIPQRNPGGIVWRRVYRGGCTEGGESRAKG